MLFVIVIVSIYPLIFRLQDSKLSTRPIKWRLQLQPSGPYSVELCDILDCWRPDNAQCIKLHPVTTDLFVQNLRADQRLQRTHFCCCSHPPSTVPTCVANANPSYTLAHSIRYVMQRAAVSGFCLCKKVSLFLFVTAVPQLHRLHGDYHTCAKFFLKLILNPIRPFCKLVITFKEWTVIYLRWKDPV